MTCADFQQVLPYIVETGGNAEQEAHLKSCQICSDLVADLRYIAEAAKLLVPMEDPSPRVWDGIERALQKEGLVRPAGPGRRLLGHRRSGPVPWITTIGALFILFLGFTLYQRTVTADQPTRAVTNGTAFASGDSQLLAEVGRLSPELRATYEHNLRYVNSFISDAQRQVEQNPSDAEAHDLLMRAYAQKNMLYRMAVDRTIH